MCVSPPFEDMSEDQFRKMLFGKRAVQIGPTAPTDRSVYSGDRDDVPRLDIQRATSRLRQGRGVPNQQVLLAMFRGEGEGEVPD